MKYNSLRKTHKEFIEKLKIKNPKAYKELEFLEKYKEININILAKNKYGKISISPISLYAGNLPNIKSAINKHEYFLNTLKEKNKEAYTELEFLEEYKEANIKILAKDRYGKILMLPKVLCVGGVSTIRAAINKHEYFLNILKEKNPNALEELEFLEKYKNSYTKILCKDKYGSVLIYPNSILHQGSISSIKSAVNKNEYFISMACEIHGNKYDYSMVEYKNARTKVKIICKKHGSFFQIPDSHLQGQGCPKCSGHFEKQYKKNNIPLYETFHKSFEFVGIKCRRDLNDKNILNVRCHLCDKWFIPTYSASNNKKNYINGTTTGENNLYCSDECKRSCATFGQQTKFKWQSPSKSDHELAGFYDSSSLKTWSDQVKINANHTCEKCGSTNDLCSHHIQPKSIAPELALDPDNGLCLCYNCHMDVHKIEGCGLGELRQCKLN